MMAKETHDMTNLAGDKMDTDLVRLVDDPDACREIAADAIQRAVDSGDSLDLATRLYGILP